MPERKKSAKEQIKFYGQMLQWAFAVAKDGHKECVMTFLTEAITAYVEKAISFNEYKSLFTIVTKNIYLEPA